MKNNKHSNVRKTTEQFIEEARQVHGDKYNYSKVEYINANTKVCIICPEHGEFWQRPYDHLNGHNCPKCIGRGAYKSTTQEFIEKAKNIHGDKYDYSKVEYINNHTNVCIICPVHGEFQQKPNSHLMGCGCPACAGNIKLTTEEFIEKTREIHGDKYDYSKAEYVDYYTKVCIICPDHGEFWQTPNSHLMGCGCPACVRNAKLTNVRTKILKRIERTAFELVDFDYKGYDDCNIVIKCKECGTIKKYKSIKCMINPTCTTCEYNRYKQRAIENVSKCKTFKEFREKYPNDEKWLRAKGLSEEITSHLKRGQGIGERLIYVYEIYVEGMKPHAYIGLTYNLEIRDKQHLYKGEEDSLWRFCKEHNVAMPKPKILLDYVPEGEASQMEAFYEKQYRERGFETINIAKCGGLGGGSNHTFEEISAIGKKYSSRNEWAKNDAASYAYAINHYKNVNGKKVKWIELIITETYKKPIIATNVNTNEIRIYESIYDTRKDGFDYSNVGRVCKNKRKSHKGWIFRYIKDGEIENVA